MLIEGLKKRRFKIFIIASVICPLILGIVAIIIWFTLGQDPDTVWIIPFGFVIGFFAPLLFIIYVLYVWGGFE